MSGSAPISATEGRRPARSGRRTVRVLVVGQVPPPHHGQTIMVETLLRGSYEAAELVHLDTPYSRDLDEIGRVSLTKVVRLVQVVVRALRHRVASRTRVLYYHPAGANRSAVLRDVVALTLLRPFFGPLVFHYHARGLPGAVDALPGPLASLARRAYRGADVALAPSSALLEEAMVFAPRRAVVIPNGTAGGLPRTPSGSAGTVTVLFLNRISEPKGAHWLLHAVAELRSRGVFVEVVFAGSFATPAERERFEGVVADLELRDQVRLLGIVTGAEKWAAFADADVFCVPTTYDQESFGLAMVEAASCGLPIVTTDVPGVREVFESGRSALLADPADRSTLTDLLAMVCEDAALRETLGRSARALFEARYTEERYWSALDELFGDLADHSV